MSNTKEKFSLAQILSVSTGLLLCPFDELVKLTDHLAGHSLFTHELAMYADNLRDAVVKQIPNIPTELNMGDLSGKSFNDIKSKLSELNLQETYEIEGSCLNAKLEHPLTSLNSLLNKGSNNETRH